MMPVDIFEYLVPGSKAVVHVSGISVPCIFEGYNIDLSGCTLRLYVDESVYHFHEEVHDNVK